MAKAEEKSAAEIAAEQIRASITWQPLNLPKSCRKPVEVRPPTEFGRKRPCDEDLVAELPAGEWDGLFGKVKMILNRAARVQR